LIVGGEMRLRLATEKAGPSPRPVADFFSVTIRCAVLARPAAPGWRAEICNDTTSYKTLMLLGNRSAGLGRRVSVWDRLDVNGALVLGTPSTPPAGTPSAIWNKRTKPPEGYLRRHAQPQRVDTRAPARCASSSTWTTACCRPTCCAWATNGACRPSAMPTATTAGCACSTGQHRLLRRLRGRRNVDLKGGFTGSDLRLKDNIRVLENATAALCQLRGVRFDWRSGGRSVGLIAQEVEAVLPDAVAEGPDGWKGINPAASSPCWSRP
jgi:hypothetical protein